jgi:predicted metal-binding protein
VSKWSDKSEQGDKSEQIAKIDPARAAASLSADAQRYAALALELGASAAQVVSATKVLIDERVTLKCAVPKCFGYGTCANCPPYAPSADSMRAVVARYATAVVLRLEVVPEVLVRDRTTIQERVDAYKNMFSIVGRLESAAFYDGHYLSAGFAAGSCKSTFCHDVECAVLARQKCRHNLVSRPSMEAVGIDCFTLAAELGWDMYPVGSSAVAPKVPSGSLLGIVFVA